MFDDELEWGLVAFFAVLAFWGWVCFFISRNDVEDMITELPTGCILYEDKIWCEVNDNDNK